MAIWLLQVPSSLRLCLGQPSTCLWLRLHWLSLCPLVPLPPQTFVAEAPCQSLGPSVSHWVPSIKSAPWLFPPSTPLWGLSLAHFLPSPAPGFSLAPSTIHSPVDCFCFALDSFCFSFVLCPPPEPPRRRSWNIYGARMHSFSGVVIIIAFTCPLSTSMTSLC